MTKLVGHSEIFGDFYTDTRIEEDMENCIYCKVEHRGPVHRENAVRNPEITDFKITLVQLTEFAKQCPSCKTIFIVKDCWGGNQR